MQVRTSMVKSTENEIARSMLDTIFSAQKLQEQLGRVRIVRRRVNEVLGSFPDSSDHD